MGQLSSKFWLVKTDNIHFDTIKLPSVSNTYDCNNTCSKYKIIYENIDLKNGNKNE